jgi:hypothetical protein
LASLFGMLALCIQKHISFNPPFNPIKYISQDVFLWRQLGKLRYKMKTIKVNKCQAILYIAKRKLRRANNSFILQFIYITSIEDSMRL